MEAEQGRYSFKNLELWKDAQSFAVQVCRLADELPPARSADVAARQLIRSATSVAANIAEGHGRFSRAAYANYLSIAKASATESQSWVDLLGQLGHLHPDRAKDLDAHAGRLIAFLTRRINMLEKEARTAMAREDGPTYDVGSEQVPGFIGSKVLDEEGGAR